MDVKFDKRQGLLLAVLVSWSLGWKAVSLWHAARDGSKPWYSALLLVNSAGILDAIYIVRSRSRSEGANRAASDSA